MAVSVIIESELGDHQAWQCVGLNQDGFLLAVSFQLQALLKADKFSEIEDAPRWIEAPAMKKWEMSLDDISEKQHEYLAKAKQLFDSQLRLKLGYPETGMVNFSYWHDAMVELRCYVTIYEFPSTAVLELGAGPLHLGTIIVFGQHVFVISEESVAGLPKARCGCTVSNIAIRQVYSSGMNSTSIPPEQPLYCYVHQVAIPIETLYEGTISSGTTVTHEIAQGRCLLCDRSVGSAYKFCPCSCYCLICGPYLAQLRQWNPGCGNCMSPMNPLPVSLHSSKVKCICGNIVTLHHDSVLCSKGHIICAKCSFFTDTSEVKCILCQSPALPSTPITESFSNTLKSCSVCETMQQELRRAECGHGKCTKCEKKGCKRCPAIQVYKKLNLDG